MSDPELIRSAVIADATLEALIGDRIYPVVLPPTIKDPATGAVLFPLMPAITYQLWTQPTDATQTDEQYRYPRWRFRIWSLSYADLTPIAVGLAAIFGNRTRTPFARSHIEYPQSQAEGHETDTHRYWRALDVVAFSSAGAVSQ
jgi:hypothetical protein